MGNICVMGDKRQLSYQFKLPGRSISEVYEAFNQALTKHRGSARVKFNGRKLSAEAMVNAVMLDFLDRSFAEQESILAIRVPEFEAKLRAAPAPPQADDIKGVAEPRVVDPPRSTRKKSG